MAKEIQNQELEDLFLRRKPAKLLIYIKKENKPYASTLAKRIDCTYAHTVKLLQKMENLGLVNFSKDGRIKFVELTDSGTELADQFDSLLNTTMSQK